MADLYAGVTTPGIIPARFATAGDPGGFWLYRVLPGLFLFPAVLYPARLKLRR